MLVSRPTDNRLRVLKQKAASPNRGLARFGLFVKEWGGVATLMIALLWTTPVAWYDRFQTYIGEQTRSDRANLARVREILSNVASLRAELVSKKTSILSPEDNFAFQSSYQYLIFTEIYQNIELIDKQVDKLKSNEIYAMASSLFMIGETKNVERYYNLALEKAKLEGNNRIIPAIHREMGNALFNFSPIHSIEKARESYKAAVKSSFELNQRNSNFYTDWYLSELGLFEMQGGDWRCGEILVGMIYPRLQSAATTGNSEAAQLFDVLQRRLASLRQSNGQPNEGCPYEIDAG